MHGPASPIKVLFVDDEPTIIELGRQFIEREGGLTVLGATTVPDALDCMRRETIDVVVSDYQLEDLSGIDLLKLLKFQEYNVPVIIFTGRGREEVVIDALNNGADFYLQKGGDPRVQFAELTRMIRRSVHQHRNEEELAHLAAIVQSSDDAIMSQALDGTIISWNTGAEKIYGYSADEAVGENIRFIIPPDRPDEFPQIREKIARGEQIEYYETERCHRSGKCLNVSIRLSPIRNKTGKIVGISSIARDMTAKKEMEMAFIHYITEMASRLKNPVEQIGIRLGEIRDQIGTDLPEEEIQLLLQIQIKNSEQILKNIRQFNQVIVDGFRDIPDAYRKYLLR